MNLLQTAINRRAWITDWVGRIITRAALIDYYELALIIDQAPARSGFRAMPRLSATTSDFRSDPRGRHASSTLDSTRENRYASFHRVPSSRVLRDAAATRGPLTSPRPENTLRLLIPV